MENAIYGDTIIFSDLHCGLSANKQSRLNICIQVIDELINFANENNIENVIFGGDWFHSRSMLDNNTINIAIKLVHRLAQNRHVFLIVGNHDAYFKNSTEINSLNIFKSEKNVKIIDKAEVVSINGKSCLLTPWLTDMSQYEKCQFDYMIGHFEISSKYLMQSYIDDNKSAVKANNMTLSKLDESISEKTANLIGSFVDVVKRNGVIFAGHIHKRREFTVRGKRFVFIGSPYQQTMGEADNQCGFYVLDKSGSYRFRQIEVTPRHIQLNMSDMANENFDFSVVRGNIIQKIYDIDVDRLIESNIQRKINDFHPYEELLPDYRVEIKYSANSDEVSEFSVDAIRKSKLDYIKNYIFSMDEQALDASGIDRDKLFEILKKYYETITGK